MSYRFIHEHRRTWPIRSLCRILGVQPSGYYAWVNRRPGQREFGRLRLTEQIRTVHAASHGRYGSPRVHRALRAQGIVVSRKRVAQLMRIQQIRSSRQRRFRVRTTDSNHPWPLAGNLLDRQFTQSRPNAVWVADITYVPTDEGWLYLATVMDLYSRRIVGWASADQLKSDLATAALEQAIHRRCPESGLMHHSDRGVQYAAGDYQAVLERAGIICSMSRSGNCYDNAAMESFFKSLKVELVYQQHYSTREEARQSIYQYIELFYNHQRLHSALGYQSPAQYEACLP